MSQSSLLEKTAITGVLNDKEFIENSFGPSEKVSFQRIFKPALEVMRMPSGGKQESINFKPILLALGCDESVNKDSTGEIWVPLNIQDFLSKVCFVFRPALLELLNSPSTGKLDLICRMDRTILDLLSASLVTKGRHTHHSS